MKPFLTAHWGNLLLFNYAVDAATLAPYLPAGCELDLFEGSPHVSLVAFQFTRTRVLGVSWPGFTSFPEVNLRFYIRYRGRRGVCFVREFVPSALVSGIARVLYNEPYAKAVMRESVGREGGRLEAHYSLRHGGRELELRASAADEPFLPEENSIEHFFKEHDLGVGRARDGSTLTYSVEHPRWRVFPVLDAQARLDAALYGAPFAFLSQARPRSVVFAEGSEIAVYPKE